MITLRELLEVSKPKEMLVGDSQNMPDGEPFWYELVEYSVDAVTLELRGWLDKQVVGVDVQQGKLKVTVR